jgi:hypothetical protein
MQSGSSVVFQERATTTLAPLNSGYRVAAGERRPL